jgi:hypothetical protein
MFRKILVLPFLLLFLVTYSQTVKTQSIEQGLDRFILGNPKSLYGSDIQKGTYSPDSENIYQYKPFLLSRFIVDEVSFPILLLYFNKEDKLKAIQFIKMYVKSTAALLQHSSENPKKNSKEDIRKLVKYFRLQWNSQPKKKIYYRSSTSTNIGYEWSNDKTMMKLTWNSFEKTEDASISMEWEYKK